MVCHICKKNQATVHLTEIVNHTVREMHICEECARDQQTKLSASPLEPIAQSLIPSPVPDVPKEFMDRKCPVCGITLQQFRTKARFGCPNDYDFFQEVILPVLAKIQGATQYRGKIPKGTSHPKMEMEHELYQLEQELKKLVQREDYEAAAQIRDKIQSLRLKLSSGDSISSESAAKMKGTKREGKKNNKAGKKETDE